MVIGSVCWGSNRVDQLARAVRPTWCGCLGPF